DGNYSHDIGREGQGPGEFQSIRLITVSGGLVTVYDRTLLRLSIFRTDGVFIRSYSLANRIRTLLPNEVFLTPDETLVLVREHDTFDHQSGITTRWSSAVVQVVTVEEDTLVSLSTDRVIINISGRSIGSRHYFRCYPRAIYRPSNGIYLTTGRDPAIDVYDLNGRLQRIIKIELPPEPVTSQERMAIRSFFRQSLAEADDERSRERAESHLENTTFCDPKAFWQGISIDEDGFIWATYPGYLYRMDQEVLRTTEYRILGPTGEYLGDTQFPDNVFLGFISRGHLVGYRYNAESESNDFVVFRIRSRVPGFSYP
ncbi:hypothetical protein ACFL6R_06240, partial [Gemmatimonadota bacterium]